MGTFIFNLYGSVKQTLECFLVITGHSGGVKAVYRTLVQTQQLGRDLFQADPGVVSVCAVKVNRLTTIFNLFCCARNLLCTLADCQSQLMQ